jgi:hypothetical protein
LIPPANQAQAQKDWDVAIAAVDGAVTEICDVAAAIEKGESGDLAGANAAVADAVACCICIIDVLTGVVGSCGCASAVPSLPAESPDLVGGPAPALDANAKASLADARAKLGQFAEAAAQ